MSTIREHFDYLPNIKLASRSFICGCEFEIEAVEDIKKSFYDSQITIDEDHSLRNNGKEFKTNPHSYEDTLALFQTLHNNIQLGKDPFSDRTSIHVHINVRELTLKEVRQLILTYALLEPLFFEFVGQKRKDSIFCVPLNHTYIPNFYKDSVSMLHKKWQKYTAFNIVPLGQHPKGDHALGTVEFRHMYGTGDIVLFSQWLRAIKELYDFIANTEDFDVLKELASGTDVVDMAHTIVPTLATQADNVIRELLKDTTMDVKLAAGGLKKEKEN